MSSHTRPARDYLDACPVAARLPEGPCGRSTRVPYCLSVESPSPRNSRSPRWIAPELDVRERSEGPSHAALVDGSDLVAESERALTEPAPAWRQRRIHRADSRAPWHRDQRDQRKALARIDPGVTDDDARSKPALFVTDRGIEID